MKLYRYLSAKAAIKTIEKHQLYVGRPKEFNDPFEWRLGIHNIEQLSQEKIEEEKQRIERLLEKMYDKFGLICFSAALDDPILWSHYADKHHGLAIEFEATVGDALVAVNYDKSDLPVVPANHRENPSSHDQELKEVFTNLFKQKAPSWRYEKEYRSIIDLGNCEVKGGKYFQKIYNNNDVTRVLIGYRSTVSVNYIHRALEMNGWENPQAAKAKLSHKEYKVEFE